MQVQSSPSLSRFMRQLIFVPCLHNRWLTAAVKQNLANTIARAEKGHRGEIVLIIENHLPIGQAYHVACHERAVALFGEYRVWDTEHNTGILVYMNICEHDLEIVADRGIDREAQGEWEKLCQQALAQFKSGKIEQGLIGLIEALGEILNTHYPCDDMRDELSNAVVYLR